MTAYERRNSRIIWCSHGTISCHGCATSVAGATASCRAGAPPRAPIAAATLSAIARAASRSAVRSISSWIWSPSAVRYWASWRCRYAARRSSSVLPVRTMPVTRSSSLPREPSAASRKTTSSSPGTTRSCCASDCPRPTSRGAGVGAGARESQRPWMIASRIGVATPSASGTTPRIRATCERSSLPTSPYALTRGETARTPRTERTRAMTPESPGKLSYTRGFSTYSAVCTWICPVSIAVVPRTISSIQPSYIPSVKTMRPTATATAASVRALRHRFRSRFRSASLTAISIARSLAGDPPQAAAREQSVVHRDVELEPAVLDDGALVGGVHRLNRHAHGERAAGHLPYVLVRDRPDDLVAVVEFPQHRDPIVASEEEHQLGVDDGRLWLGRQSHLEIACAVARGPGDHAFVVVVVAGFPHQVVIGQMAPHPALGEEAGRDTDQPVRPRAVAPQPVGGAQRRRAGLPRGCANHDQRLVLTLRPDFQREHSGAPRPHHRHRHLRMRRLRTVQLVQMSNDAVEVGKLFGLLGGHRRPGPARPPSRRA